MEEERNSRVTLKGTGKVVREAEDRKEELDRQGGKKRGGEDENEGGVRGARKKPMEKGKRVEQEKVPLKKDEDGKTH